MIITDDLYQRAGGWCLVKGGAKGDHSSDPPPCGMTTSVRYLIALTSLAGSTLMCAGGDSLILDATISDCCVPN